MASFAPPPAVIPPDGQVDLKDKLKPICETEGPHPPLAYSRGHHDITAWKAKLAEIADSPVWFEHDVHSSSTVKMARAAHDAWGVHKIIFTFSDDFLLKVIDLPNSQDPGWRALLLPIYEQLGIPEDRVVRSLLARMPAGVQVPVHHDTGTTPCMPHAHLTSMAGYWVMHTHRCHVALETSEQISFMVGATPSAMQKVSFDEGRIVELNNQAKHCVMNDLPEGKYRTHLIFDYVEAGYPLPARKLIPNGETIFQTRRSLDTGTEVRNYSVQDCQPKFIVIGAQKCGTTSMYEYICQHPLIAKGKRRETHYFDWRYNDTLQSVQEHREYYMQFYERAQLAAHPSISTGESTPSYLLHADIVLPRLKAYVPWAKLIVMLRNPIDRAYSQYQMVSDHSGSTAQLALRGHSAYQGMSFQQVVEKEISELQEQGITADSSYEQFERKVLAARREMKHGGHSVLVRGLYALQLEPYLAQWPVDQLKVLCMEMDLKGGAKAVQPTMNEVFSFLGLPPSDIEDAEAKNSRSYPPMDDEVRKRLEDFYRPYNARLYKRLGRKLVWD